MNQKLALSIFGILVLVAGVAASVGLVGRPQEIRKKAQVSQINAEYDNTGIRHLYWNGTDLMTGGGYYIIGSCTGDDVPAENVISIGGDGHTLYAPGSCPGAPYSMTITGSNPYRVSIAIGPLPVDYNSLSVPMDPVKEYFDRFTFSHSGYRVGCSGTWEDRSGNSDTFASIPTPCFIEGPGGGPVGVAQVISADAGSWVEESGSRATIRRTIISTNAKNTGAVNHPGTNGIGFGFDIEPPYHQILPRGSTYTLEEELLITDPNAISATISGPNSGNVNQELTYTGTLGSGATKGEIWVSYEDGLSDFPCPPGIFKNSSNEYWCKIGESSNTTFQATYTPTQTGTYPVSINAYSNGHQCSGNPFGRFDRTVWPNCSSQDHIQLTVSAAPSPSSLVGDINNDRKVDLLDYTILFENFGTNNKDADLNGDGTVNLLDYTLLFENFGRTS